MVKKDSSLDGKLKKYRYTANSFSFVLLVFGLLLVSTNMTGNVVGDSKFPFGIGIVFILAAIVGSFILSRVKS